MKRLVFTFFLAIGYVIVIGNVVFIARTMTLKAGTTVLQVGRNFARNAEENGAKSWCHKASPFDSFIICNGSLPFTNTDCGIENRDKGQKYLVPNIIHYVWFGKMKFQFYQYLSVRSAAANQRPEAIIFHVNDSKPGGKCWRRIEKEIPCIRVKKIVAPTTVFGNKIENVLHQTDVARMQILLQHGGIYLDSDAIVLKSLDPLRKYPLTLGRSTEMSLSNGVILAQRNATFLLEWFNLHSSFDSKKVRGIRLAEYSVKLPLRLHAMKPELPLHVEAISMQRPNPWADGRSCISHSSYNISSNYILHLHPQKSALKDPDVFENYREEKLRTYDTTYGAAARAALFGTQDLIFLRSESTVPKNRKVAKDIIPFKEISKYHFSSLIA